MKNSIGESISITLFGESHGAGIGAVLDGLCPGIIIDEKAIQKDLERRRGLDLISTPRREKDEYKFLSGILSGCTTGTPISVIIENKDIDSSSYAKSLPRPSHADITAEAKYHGFQDARGGGHFSGRITAPIVLLGSICKKVLENKGIIIASHIKNIGNIKDDIFSLSPEKEMLALKDEIFPLIDKSKKEEMISLISECRKNQNSIGGSIECAVCGMPAGAGEPWFDTIEGEIAKMLFSVPAVKGVEFGKGFAFSEMLGSEANDPIILKDGKLATEKNNNGGILGGITSGMPIIFSAAIKPTPSISLEQKTVSLTDMKETTLRQGGRHDPCIVPRAAVVIENAVAITLCDILAKRFGTDFLRA